LQAPSQLQDPSATLALSLQTHPAEEESVFLSLAGQLAQVHFPGGHVQVSPHEQADASFLLGQLAQVHWPGGQVQVSPHLYHQPMLRSEKIRKEVDLRASGFTLVSLVGTIGTSTLARLAGTYFSTAIISSHHVYITERGKALTCKRIYPCRQWPCWDSFHKYIYQVGRSKSLRMNKLICRSSCPWQDSSHRSIDLGDKYIQYRIYLSATFLHH
jgi:hypothetical protein